MSDKDNNCLLSIIDAINRIENYCKGFDNADLFYNDDKSFDAALMNFVVIGEMVNKLSEEFTSNNSFIDWLRVKDFRNIIAHNYFGIDAEEVWQIINDDLPKLKEDINSISKF